MFGADTALVVDAMQMAGVAAAVGASAVYLLMKRRKRRAHIAGLEAEKSDLEQRVRVLERIATDRSIDLADEIEALRHAPDAARHKVELEGSAQ